MFIQDELRGTIYNRPLRDRLIQYEEDNNVPIRLLASDTSGPPSSRGWVAAHVAATDCSVSDGMERGITIWHYTTSRGVGDQGHATTHVGPHNESYIAAHQLRDPGPAAGIWIPCTADISHTVNTLWQRPNEFCVGEVSPHVIHDWIGWGRYPEHSLGDDYEVALLAALDQCREELFIMDYLALVDTRAMEALEVYARNTYSTHIEALRSTITSHENVLSQYQQRVTQTFRTLQQEQQVLEAVMAQGVNQANTKIVRDFKLLREHNRIEVCEFSGTALHIVTTDDFRITRPDTDESRWLGKFDISIDFQACRTTITNLSTPRQGRQHPHVASDSTPCFGGHEEDFRELMLQGEMLLYFELLVQYLETLNLRDVWGAFGAYWFELPDEKPLITDDVVQAAEAVA